MGYEMTGNFYRDSVTHNSYRDRYILTHSNNYLGSYLEIKLPISVKLAFRVGGRFEYETKNDDSHFDPRVSLGYKVNDDLTLNIAYGLYHQLPELKYYVDNPTISLQKSQGGTIGIDYDLENVMKLRGEFYYKDYDDLILLESTNQNSRQYSNFGHGRSFGVDLLFKHVGENYEYWLSYSYLDAKRKELLLGKFASPEYDITNNLSFIYKKHITENFDISLRQTFHTGKPYSDSSLFLNDKRLPNYSKTDFNFSYKTSLFGNDLSIVYVAISNIFGKDNVLNRRYNHDYTDFIDQKSTFLRSVYFGISISLL